MAFQGMLIGLTGAAGAGKDTVGRYLHRDYFFRQIALASPIKGAIDAILGRPGSWDNREWKERPLLALGGKSPRYAAQTLGTEWGRTLMGPTFWIDLVEDQIRPALRGGHDVVVTDVRFPQEADMIHRNGGAMWEIIRPGITPVEAHSSEAGLPRGFVDIQVQNTADFGSLWTVVDVLMERAR